MNRLHAPRPLYRFDRWVAVSGLSDLYGHPADRFHDDRLRETLGQVHAYDEEIQTAAALPNITHFGVPADRVLYDITSLYIEGEHTESELIECGYSWDQKPDKKQVNVGLTVSAEGGVPLLSRALKAVRRMSPRWRRTPWRCGGSSGTRGCSLSRMGACFPPQMSLCLSGRA